VRRVAHVVTAPAPARPAWAVRRRTPALVAALALLALALRLPQLDQSLFGDELFAYDEVARRSFGGMLDAVLHGPEVTPPLYFVLAWVSAHIGDPAIWLRLPSLIAGVALVPVTYALGALTVGRRAALAAAAIVALSPHAGFYAVEARPYALLALAAAASTVCLLRALDTRQAGWWAAYAAVSLAAVSTHLTAIFVLGAQALWAAVTHRDQLRQIVVANVVAGIAFAPWLPRLRRDDVGWLLNLYGGFDPSPSELADELAHELAGYPFVRLDAIPGAPAAVAFFAVVVVLLGAAAVAAWRRRGAVHARGLLIALLPLAVLAGLFANSALSDRDLVSARNLISALPYLALALGALAVRLPRRPAAAALAVMLGVLALGSVQALGEKGQRPRYRDAAAYVERIARPGDLVLERLLFPAFGEFGRPLTAHLAVQLDPRLPHQRGGEDADAVRRADRSGGRILLVQPSPFATVGVPDAIGHYRLTGRRTFAGIHPVGVAVYER
jgi:4-amino-4-deoxy-L-arabinose transferase-like glycosyltransferase